MASSLTENVRKDLYRRTQAKLEECAIRRKETLSKINDIISNTDDIESQRDVLNDLKSSQLPRVRDQIVALATAIGDIAKQSSASCSKFQQYDVMNDRVQQAMRIAQAMISHKSSLNEIHNALTVCDYEKAAQLANQCSQLRQEYKGITCFEEDIDPVAVDQAISKVQDSLREELASSLRRGDGDMVVRFTKLFPLVGLHQEGCSRYIKFVRELASKELAQHVDSSLQTIREGGKAITHLLLVSQILDHVVGVMEREEKTVQDNFGVMTGSDSGMQYMLLELHAECTTHCVNVLDAYQKSMSGSSSSSSAIHKEKKSLKTLDRTLDEISQLTACCHMYLTYVDGRIRNENIDGSTRQRFSSALTDTKLSTAKLFDKVQELHNMYFPLQREYFADVCEEALKFDQKEGGNGMLYLDDVLYVLRVAVRRVMNTQNIVIVCSVVTLIHEVMKDKVLAEVLKHMVWDKEHNTNKKISKALGWLNTGVRAAEYTAKLSDEIVTAAEDQFAGRSADIAMCTEHTIDFRSTADQTRADIRSFLRTVASHISNTILHKGLPDFMQMSYVIGEQNYVRYETNDPWVMTTIIAWDSMLQHYKVHMTEELFSQMLVEIAILVAAQIESGIARKTYDIFGALQLDKDMRGITRFFCDRSSLPMREHFARISQMCSLLVIEKLSETGDFFRALDVGSWRLTASEVKSILTCRSDFPKEQITSMKLPFS
eukprot:PhF_6_TR11584/c0_g1_i1/m.18736/K20291/COG4, COD1; conserved oligomeric Golgi complex subunit 4